MIFPTRIKPNPKENKGARKIYFVRGPPMMSTNSVYIHGYNRQADWFRKKKQPLDDNNHRRFYFSPTPRSCYYLNNKKNLQQLQRHLGASTELIKSLRPLRLTVQTYLYRFLGHL